MDARFVSGRILETYPARLTSPAQFAIALKNAEAPLTVTCQRSLEPFVLPVALHSRLGLIRSEREESGLSPDCEPLLVDDDGKLALVDVIEDELLLALPLVPINPDSALPEEVTSPSTDESADEGRTDNPFAVLRELKK